MAKLKGRPVARRDFVKFAAGTVVAAPALLRAGTGAAQETLRIAKWAHFIPEFDVWFEGVAREWGAQHHVKITVDRIPVEKIAAAAAAEVQPPRDTTSLSSRGPRPSTTNTPSTMPGSTSLRLPNTAPSRNLPTARRSIPGVAAISRLPTTGCRRPCSSFRTTGPRSERPADL